MANFPVVSWQTDRKREIFLPFSWLPGNAELISGAFRSSFASVERDWGDEFIDWWDGSRGARGGVWYANYALGLSFLNCECLFTILLELMLNSSTLELTFLKLRELIPRLFSNFN